MKRDEEFYLHMLGRLLLEIRNLEGDELDLGPKLAYIFHNVPSLLGSNFNETDGDQYWEVIRSRAEHFKLSKSIAEWERSAFT